MAWLEYVEVSVIVDGDCYVGERESGEVFTEFRGCRSGDGDAEFVGVEEGQDDGELGRG